MLVRRVNISHPVSQAPLSCLSMEKMSVAGHCWDREDTFETPMASPPLTQVSLWLPWCR